MAKNSVNKGKHVSYKSKSKKKNASLKISFLVILMLIICGILVYILEIQYLTLQIYLQQFPI